METVPIPERVVKLAQKAKAKTRKQAPQQLPLWERSQRGMPNALARSALFNCNKAADPRANYKNRDIASLSGIRIVYTGEELRQDDADVFLEICHLAREAPLGDRVQFSGYSMLKALGWGSSKRSYERLTAAIDRLKANSTKVMFENGRKGFAGSLVRKFGWADEEEDLAETNTRTRWIVYMEPEIIALFAEDDYTRLVREQRMRLKGDLAKWLHSYYHTHAQPFPHKVSFIYEKCGSSAKELFHFRATLKRALQELVEVGFLTEWKIEDDTVYVKRAVKALNAA